MRTRLGKAIGAGLGMAAMVFMAALAPAAGAADHPSMVDAGDCSAKFQERVESVSHMAANADNPLLRRDMDTAFREVLRLTRFCAGDQLTIGGVKFKNKPIGTPIPASVKLGATTTTFEQRVVKGRSARTGSCTYGTLTPTESLNQVIGWTGLDCTYPYTDSIESCVKKYFHSSGLTGTYNCLTTGASHSATYSFHASGSAVCNSTTSYRSRGNPTRLMKGSWAGPGWIESGSWVDGGSYFGCP